MLRKILLNAVVSLIVVVTGIMVYHKHFAVKVYSLDLRGFVAEQQKILIDGKMDKEAMEKNFNRLDQIIKDKGENVVILTSEIVIKGEEIEVD